MTKFETVKKQLIDIWQNLNENKIQWTATKDNHTTTGQTGTHTEYGQVKHVVSA